MRPKMCKDKAKDKSKDMLEICKDKAKDKAKDVQRYAKICKDVQRCAKMYICLVVGCLSSGWVSV